MRRYRLPPAQGRLRRFSAVTPATCADQVARQSDLIAACKGARRHLYRAFGSGLARESAPTAISISPSGSNPAALASISIVLAEYLHECSGRKVKLVTKAAMKPRFLSSSA